MSASSNELEAALRAAAKRIFYDFNIDTEYSGDFEAFFTEYFINDEEE